MEAPTPTPMQQGHDDGTGTEQPGAAAAPSPPPPSLPPSSRCVTPLGGVARSPAMLRRASRQQQQHLEQQPLRPMRPLQAAAPPPPPPMAELAVCGEIVGASGFSCCAGAAGRALSCEWALALEPGAQQTLLRGTARGRTHASAPALGSQDGISSDCGGGCDAAVFEHPLAFVLGLRSRSGWPGLAFKVYAHSALGDREHFAGYGLLRLPAAPGAHAAVECPVWAPVQARRPRAQALRAALAGAPAPLLADEGFVADQGKRFELGQALHTQGVGRLRLRLHVALRHGERLAAAGGGGGSGGGPFAGAKARGAGAVKARGWGPAAARAFGGDQGGGGGGYGGYGGEDDDEEEEEEQISEGLRLVREGRAARMLAGRSAPGALLGEGGGAGRPPWERPAAGAAAAAAAAPTIPNQRPADEPGFAARAQQHRRGSAPPAATAWM